MEKLHSAISEWYLHFHQTPSLFHGGDWQGPHLHRLEKADSMMYLKELLQKTSASPQVFQYFNAMQAFVDLRHLCFSKVISPQGYQKELQAFTLACTALPTPKVPLKMHIISAHLKEALELTRTGTRM